MTFPSLPLPSFPPLPKRSLMSQMSSCKKRKKPNTSFIAGVCNHSPPAPSAGSQDLLLVSGVHEDSETGARGKERERER